MSIRKASQLLLVGLFIIFTFANTAFSNDLPKNHFGIKFGHFGAGTIKVENSSGYEREYETSNGFKGGIFLDYRILKQFYIGVAVDIAEIKPWMNKETLFGVSGMVKFGQHVGNGQLYLRPGFGIGYATLGDIYTVGKSDYLTFTGSLEMIAYVGKKTGLLWDIGFLYCPVEATMITISPAARF